MGTDASASAQGRAGRVATLAHRSGLLDDEGLRAALEHCARVPSADVGAWLESRGGLPPGAGDLLDRLAALLDARSGGPPTAPIDLATQAPGGDASSHGPTPMDSIGTVVSPSAFAGAVAPGEVPGPACPAPPAVRYEPIRFHDQGGLGMVYLARDRELSREVALKEIKDRHADDPASRARFVKEAEITGQLEHPGIVPIYGLGVYLDGRPFYAMRFIRGESLLEVIRAFHRESLLAPSGKEQASAHAVGLRGLLMRFLDICNAVEYAHSRGVLHRDLKPGNVMVGPFGETLVVDWGLARVMGTAEGPDASGAADGRPDASVRVSPSGGSTETTQGDMVGTVGYMSPEQAEGRLGELGPASDVYSLGAILYTILTGRQTVAASGKSEAIRAIREADFPPPRRLMPDTPRALEAICLKALSARVEGRYPTPRRLAEDLERWLADEPVEALPDRAVDRLARWARRNKQATVYAAATLVTVAAVSVAATVLVDAARRKADQARAAESLALAKAGDALRLANAARAEADRNFRQARRAVDQFLTAVSDSKELQLLPDTQAFRKDLLAKARDYYQRFIEERGDDPSVRVETGAANWRLSSIAAELGSMDEALRLGREAVRILDAPGSAAGPDDARPRELLGDALNGLATIEQRMNKTKDAEASYRRAVEAFRRLRLDHPGEADYGVKAASLLGNLGQLLALTGREDQADAALREAEAILDAGGGVERATRSGVPASLARILGGAASLRYRRGRLPEAEDLYRRSAALYERLLRDQPRVPEFRQGLANDLIGLGVLQRRSDRLAEAGRSYARAAEIYDQLARENPRVPSYRFELAGIWTNQGNVSRARNEPAEAEAVFRRAVEVLESLVRDHPGVADYRQTLAGTLGNLGNALLDLKRYDDAEAAHRRAIAIYEQLLAQSPTMVDFRHGFAGALQNLAGVIAVRSPSDEALALARRAVALQRQALASSPRNPRFLRFLDSHLEVLGRILRARGRGLEAAEATRERSELWPGDADMQYDLACEFAAASALVTGPESGKLRDEAVATLRASVAAGFDDAGHLARDPDLAPLRHLPEFRALLQSLQDRTFPADPFAP